MNPPGLHIARGRAFALAMAWLAFASAGPALDTWYTTGTPRDFTNATIWSAGVPGASDSAFFTNGASITVTNSVGVSITNANVAFDLRRGPTDTINLSAGGPWFVTNSFTIGQASVAGSTGTVTLAGGSLVVTNASRSAVLEIGRGTYGGLVVQNGATVIADNLVATNYTLVLQNRFTAFNLDASGTLVTYGMLVTNTMGGLASLTLGRTSGANSQWYMLGGTNANYTTGGLLFGANGGTGTVVVAGSQTVYIDLGAVDVGSQSPGSQFVVSNGAVANVNVLNVGRYVGASNSVLLVSGTNSVINYGSIKLGSVQAGATGALLGNLMVVSNHGAAYGGSLTLAPNGQSAGDNLVVTGPGSVLTNSSLTLASGYGASSNTLSVLDGGLVAGGSAYIGGASGTCANAAYVLGEGSVWSNTILYLGFGNAACGNLLVVSNRGAVFSAASLTFGAGTGTGINASNNTVLITGQGSLLCTSNVLMNQNAANLLVVSGGAALTNYGTANLANGPNAVAGRAVVTGTGSLWRSSGMMYLGSNGTGNGSASVLVTDGGMLSTTGLVSGWAGSGVLTNQGGVLQFTVNNPLITTNTLNSVVVSDGTVAFSGASAANVTGQITRIAYTGANTLRLENSTNVFLGTYAFSNGSAFSTLDLAGASAWRGTNVIFGAGGRLVGSGQLAVDTVTVGGTLAPGHSPGSLIVSNNLTLLDSSLFILEIASTNSSAYDFLGVGGLFTKAGTVLVTNLGYTFLGGETFNFFDAASLAGSFSSLTLPTLSGGMSWDASLFESQGILSVVAVPEPSGLAVLAVGLALLAFRRARR